MTLHEDPQKQISIKTGGVTARRSGADPPPLSLIKEYGGAGQGPQRDGDMNKGKTSRYKQKTHPIRRRQGSLTGNMGKINAKGKGKTRKSKTAWVKRQLEEIFSSTENENQNKEEIKTAGNASPQMMDLKAGKGERETV